MNKLLSRPWLALGLLLAGLALAAGASYLVPSCGQAREVREQAAAQAAHQQGAAASQQAQTTYRIDSTRLATQAAFYRHRDSVLAAAQHELLRRQSTRRPLPAWAELPRAN